MYTSDLRNKSTIILSFFGSIDRPAALAEAVAARWAARFCPICRLPGLVVAEGPKWYQSGLLLKVTSNQPKPRQFFSSQGRSPSRLSRAYRRGLPCGFAGL
jgi:hypothetical protein